MAELARPLALKVAGEGEARERPLFGDLYDTQFGFAWRNLRRLGVPDASLADAAQDVFLVVHRRLADFEPRGSVRSWVYSIVVRVARQHRRTLRRKPSHAVEDESEWVDATAPGPEQRAEQSEGLRQLLGLLEALDDNKREAFVLAELEGLTAPEIAEILHVNVNTIYARIRAARQALELALAEAEQAATRRQADGS
jgi:RNA polymerase sigma-70 factor (ECF subfamily)